MVNVNLFHFHAPATCRSRHCADFNTAWQGCAFYCGPSTSQFVFLDFYLFSCYIFSTVLFYVMYVFLILWNISVKLDKLPPIKDRGQTDPNLKPWPWPMILSSNPGWTTVVIHTREKIKVEGHWVQKIEWKQTDGRTRPIATLDLLRRTGWRFKDPVKYFAESKPTL